MDVKEFVTETLKQIHHGILDAQENDDPSQKVHQRKLGRKLGEKTRDSHLLMAKDSIKKT